MIGELEGKTVIECEKYRLVFTHDVVCSDGKRMRLEEPFTVEINCMYGEPYPRGVVLDKLFYEMRQRLKEVEE